MLDSRNAYFLTFEPKKAFQMFTYKTTHLYNKLEELVNFGIVALLKNIEHTMAKIEEYLRQYITDPSQHPE